MRAGSRRGPAGLALVATAYALVWSTSLLGPSAASRPLPGGGPLPLGLGLAPSAWLVTGLLVFATAVGLAGTLLAWSAVARGWAPDPRRLLAGGLVAIAAFPLVAPVTSDDVYSYAAYGRMAATGRDPYTTVPEDLDDPVGDAVTDPWRDSPSIYGPVATAEQALVMRLAGTSVRLGVWLLALLGAVAAAATAWLLDRLAGDADRRRRAALLFGLNPFVVVHLVAGAHVDALLVLCVVGAVAAVRRWPLLAGALAGAAFGVKSSGALAVLGLAWWLRRAPRRLAALALGCGLVAVPAYLAVGGLTAFGQVRRASRFVSFATPWRRLATALDRVVGQPDSRTLVGLLALAVIVALAVLLLRALPGPDGPARPPAALFLAWVLGTTYLLPWYDSWVWALLPLLAWSRWDRLLLAHTAVLTLAYLPGSNVPLPPALAGLTSFVRRTAAPLLLTALLVLAVAWAVRGREAGGGGETGRP